MKRTFDIEREEYITLGVTVYLLGLACGCLVLAPMSEVYGRRPIFFCSIFFFALLTLPCALATSLKEILIARFFACVTHYHYHYRRPWTLPPGSLRLDADSFLKGTFRVGHAIQLPGNRQ
jgi:MFS family permease